MTTDERYAQHKNKLSANKIRSARFWSSRPDIPFIFADAYEAGNTDEHRVSKSDLPKIIHTLEERLE